MKSSDIHILLIGPRLNRERTNLGGATSSFEEMIAYFQGSDIKVNVLNTQKGKGLGRIIHLIIGYFYKVISADVVFINLSQNGMEKLAPKLAPISSWMGKKVVIRPFGSSIKSIYEELSPSKKKAFRKHVLGADILYLQTQELVNFFHPLSHSVKQLKTSRQKPSQDLMKQSSRFQKRFVFLGQIKKEKGIDELLDCIKRLDQSYQLDLYGPIEEPEYEFLKAQPYYKGLLKSREQVLSALGAYDVLVLPTYYSGEGYPGVIIEAYSLGMPVITTSWKAIPEIVVNNETGLLVPPQSSVKLQEAMLKFDEDNLEIMSQKALDYFYQNLDTDTILRQVSLEIKELFTQ